MTPYRLLITFYGRRSGVKMRFICADFAYAARVMGKRSYGWTIL